MGRPKLAALIMAWAFLTLPVAVQSQRTPSQGTLSALDYFEIEQLYARYCHGLDSGADNGYMFADVFTPDGIFVNQAGVVRQGRDQLAEFGRGGPGAKKGPTVLSHVISNVAIEPAPGGATGRSYLLLPQAPAPGGTLRAAITNGGQYWDELVKTPDGWRIKKRVNRQPHLPPPAATRPQASSSVSPAVPTERRSDNSKIRLSAADYVEIYQLYGRYGYAFDGGLDSGKEWASLFTPDGFHSNASNNEWVKGPGALADFARGALRFERGFVNLVRMEGTSKDPTRIAHIITNIMLEPTSEGVVAKAYRLVAGIGENGQPNTLATAGMYFDLLVKTSEGWRYKEKFYMGTETVPDLAKRFIVPATSSTVRPVTPADARTESPRPQNVSRGADFTPEDYAELEQLYARSSVVFDNGAEDGTAFAKWFTSDGVFTDGAGNRHAGHDKLAQLAKGKSNGDRTPAVQTFLYNIKLARSSEGTTGSAYTVTVRINEVGKPITVNDAGQYHDVLVKTAQGWRIKTRRFVRAAAGGLAISGSVARSQWSPD